MGPIPAQAGGIGVARLSDSPPSEARIIAGCAAWARLRCEGVHSPIASPTAPVFTTSRLESTSSLSLPLEQTAVALENVDSEMAESALVRARQTDDQVDELREALEGARETVRLSPVRRQSLGCLGYYELATDHLDLIVPGARVLARAALRLLRGGEPAPEPLSGAVRGLSRAVGALAEYPEEPGRSPDETCRFALGAMREATALLEERNDLAIAALAAQIRSTAVDVLRGPAWTTGKRWRRSSIQPRRDPGAPEGTKSRGILNLHFGESSQGGVPRTRRRPARWSRPPQGG